MASKRKRGAERDSTRGDAARDAARVETEVAGRVGAAGPASLGDTSREADSPGAVSPLSHWRLKLLVFWAGAVLMGLEIAGSRVLAPHFGNSVFVWGSLITVFLAALAGGNYLGGTLADQHPSTALLSGICCAVAVWVGGLSLVASGVGQFFADQGLGEEFGPMAASLVLFLPPSLGMGMISPLAVRIATSTVAGVGRTSGSLYALSTAGSIVGTIATTFILIPSIGLAAILRGLGLSLLLVALGTQPFWRGTSGVTGVVLLALLAMAPLQPRGGSLTLNPGERIVAEFGTPYHNVAVIDDDARQVRQLRFDRYVESAIMTEPPYVSLAEYTHYFHLAFLAQPRIERALFIGAGGGIGPRTFREHAPDAHIDVVDIDPRVLEVAQTHFHLTEHPATRLIAADGRMFVRGSRDSYDCIVLDAFSIGGRIPFHLATSDFFRLCRQRLAPGGVFVMNINSAIEGPWSHIYHSLYKTLAAEFPQTYAFAHGSANSAVPSGDEAGKSREQSTNILLVATSGRETWALDEWRRRAHDYDSKSYVGRDVVKLLVENLVTDPPDMSAAPVLTDDYAPIETMAF